MAEEKKVEQKQQTTVETPVPEKTEDQQIAKEVKLTEANKQVLTESLDSKTKLKSKVIKKALDDEKTFEANKPIMKVNKIHKSFELATGAIKVLDDISFEILPGSFNIVFGPSGSGKTTVLNTILGLEKPDSGTVHFYNQDLYELTQDEMSEFRAHRYGVVYQSSNWVESLNVIENVSLPLLFMGMNKSWAHGKAREILEVVGMAEFENRDPKTLSGGQQQRISLARSLVNNPWVIVADEPTGNLDSKAGAEVMKLLYHLNKDLKRTIILVTHNLEYVILASQMIYIKDGRMSNREEALPKPITIV